jgi:hypothetical protein
LSDEQSENSDSWIIRSFEPDSNVTDDSVGKSPKQPSARTTVGAGTEIDSSEEQSKNAPLLISRTLDPDSNVNDLRDGIRERASGSTASDAGRQSDSNRSHLKNDLDSIASRFDSNSKTTDDKLEHLEKQDFRMKRTDLGIKIDLSERQLLKADSPISESWQPVSNVTTESDEHP